MNTVYTETYLLPQITPEQLRDYQCWVCCPAQWQLHSRREGAKQPTQMIHAGKLPSARTTCGCKSEWSTAELICGTLCLSLYDLLAPGDGLVCVAWPHKAPNIPTFPQRLGILGCFNRPCALWAAAAPDTSANAPCRNGAGSGGSDGSQLASAGQEADSTNGAADADEQEPKVGCVTDMRIRAPACCKHATSLQHATHLHPSQGSVGRNNINRRSWCRETPDTFTGGICAGGAADGGGAAAERLLAALPTRWRPPAVPVAALRLCQRRSRRHRLRACLGVAAGALKQI